MMLAVQVSYEHCECRRSFFHYQIQFLMSKFEQYDWLNAD